MSPGVPDLFNGSSDMNAAIAGRVARGAALLDEADPGWWEAGGDQAIDLAGLWMLERLTRQPPDGWRIIPAGQQAECANDTLREVLALLAELREPVR